MNGAGYKNSTRSVSTSNGTIGGLIEGKYQEVGIWAQVAF